MRFAAHSDEQLDCWLANETEENEREDRALSLAESETDDEFLERLDSEIPDPIT